MKKKLTTATSRNARCLGLSLLLAATTGLIALFSQGCMSQYAKDQVNLLNSYEEGTISAEELQQNIGGLGTFFHGGWKMAK